MSKQPIKNMGASVRARLMAISRERNQTLQLVLTNYVLERLTAGTSAMIRYAKIRGADSRDAGIAPFFAGRKAVFVHMSLGRIITVEEVLPPRSVMSGRMG